MAEANSNSQEANELAAPSNGDTCSSMPKSFNGFSSQPDLEKIRQMMVNFREERGWGKYHTPRNLLLALVSEVGELSELFQWRPEVTNGLPDWSEQEKKDLGDELSDVIVYTIGLANACHVDLPAAVVKKMEQNKQKYPAE